MARLSDLVPVLKSVGPVTFTRRLWREVRDDDLFVWASALAYAWLLAIFPFLIFLLTLVPQLPRGLRNEAKHEVHALLQSAMPGNEAAKTVWDNIEGNVDNLLHQREGKLLPRLIGLGLALWAASGGMSLTLAALDKCYDLDKPRPFYGNRGLGLTLTLLSAVLAIVVVSLLPLGALVRNWLIAHQTLAESSPLLLIFDLARFFLTLIALFAAVGILYHFGPFVRQRFCLFTPGALFCIAVWLGLGLLVHLYVVRWANFGQTYGAVGGVAVLLIYFYVDALVLLIGAEINSEIDFEVLKVRRGSSDFCRAADVGTEPPGAM